MMTAHGHNLTPVTFALTITASTSLSIGAGGSSGTLADKSIVRDGWGRPVIPGSQVKGKARHAAEAVAASLGLPVANPFEHNEVDYTYSPIVRLFGSAVCRSCLHFADLPGVIGDVDPMDVPPGVEQCRQHVLRPSVAINRRRGIAEDARLMYQEATLPGVRFASHDAIVGHLPGLGEVALLWAALRLTTRWGGATSRGLGWAEVQVDVYWDNQREPLLDDQLEQALHNLVREQPKEVQA